MKRKNKAIGINALLNSIKTISSIIFPLITFPYISRVLKVDNVGVYNFCSAFINYFALIAGLGINTYAIREGAGYRDDRKKISEFSSEIFTINVISTLVAYVSLIMFVCFIPQFRTHWLVICILSTSIFFTTVGCEWVFNVFEEFGYITVRTIAFQFLSLILMFVMVRDEQSLVRYALVTVVASSGANVVNIISRRKYCNVHLTLNKNLVKHIIPVIVLFANSIAMTIYINSDVTILGLICGDYYVGLYSVATKVYTILKSLLGALIVVSIPRLSAYIGKEEYVKYEETARTIFISLLSLAVPAMVGTFMLSKNIVLILSGADYISSTSALQILSVALLCSIFSWFYTSCVLVVNKQEKKILIATTLAATVNIVANVILIPHLMHNATAITTALAEFISAYVCFLYSRKFYKTILNIKDLVSVVIGSSAIWIACSVVNRYITSLILSTVIAVIASVIAYVIVLIIFKNSSIMFLIGRNTGCLGKNNS